jgi:hypothetical protein
MGAHDMSKPELLILGVTFVAAMVFVWNYIVKDLPDDLFKKRKD